MANRTLIRNGTVVTMNDGGDVHFGGPVLLHKTNEAFRRVLNKMVVPGQER